MFACNIGSRSAYQDTSIYVLLKNYEDPFNTWA